MYSLYSKYTVLYTEICSIYFKIVKSEKLYCNYDIIIMVPFALGNN